MEGRLDGGWWVGDARACLAVERNLGSFWSSERTKFWPGSETRSHASCSKEALPSCLGSWLGLGPRELGQVVLE